MDPKSRDQTWLSQIDLIFKGSTAVIEGESGQINEMKHSLKTMSHKRMKLWWNKATLENYLNKNLIPRGLRIQVFPSFPIEDQLFRTRWEEACSICSKTMMELLIGMNKKDLENIEKEIESVRTKLTENLSPTGLEALNNELDKQYTLWEKEIQDQKTKKFQRDVNDYQQKRVYRWFHGFERRQRGRPRSQSVSSMSSTGSAATGSIQDEKQRTYYGKRKEPYDTRNNRSMKSPRTEVTKTK